MRDMKPMVRAVTLMVGQCQISGSVLSGLGGVAWMGERHVGVMRFGDSGCPGGELSLGVVGYDSSALTCALERWFLSTIVVSFELCTTFVRQLKFGEWTRGACGIDRRPRW